MRRQFPASIVENDLTFCRMLDHTGLQIIRNQSRHAALEPTEHRHISTQPGILPHIQSRLHERKPAEGQTRGEQIHARGRAGHRIQQLHRGSGNRSRSSAPPYDRPETRPQWRRRVALSFLQKRSYPIVSSPVIRHRSRYSRCSSFNVTPTRASSRCTTAQSGYAYTLSCSPRPGNRRTYTSASDMPATSSQLTPSRSAASLTAATPGHALRGYLPTGEPLRVKSQHELCLDLTYHLYLLLLPCE